MAVLKISKENFQKEVLDYKGLVVVDFYADWCGPCRMTAPIINDLSKELTDVKFVKINVDENPDLASSYAVFSIPTFLIFKEGKMVHQIVGALSKEAFLNELNNLLQPK